MRTYRAANLNVLWFLIVLNVVLFIITLLRPAETIAFLGLTPALLSQKPWTIISSMFIHGSLFHLLFNMIGLYGLAGNILFILLAPFSTGIGASGAICALGGALAAMVPRAPVLVFPLPIPIPLWAAIIIFLFLSFLPGIAWQAHIGGLVLGLIAGLIFTNPLK